MIRILACLMLLANSSFATQRIFINNEETAVHFNDGDTFRILEGKYKNTSVRLEGFNALESYGPVHQWGDWQKEELAENSKDATVAAQQGKWHCSLDKKKDTYGRGLARCDDMAIDLMSKGLAHAMTVDNESSSKDYLQAQAKAIREGRGMWQKGVPEYIVTSLHSLDESPDAKKTYDRLVSTRDGHSFLKRHTSRYATCQTVCESPNGEKPACMVYVPFNERYGAKKAACLK